MNRNFNEKLAIDMKKGSFSWDKIEDNEDDQRNGQLTLKNIDLNIKKNSLVAVVGSVGSGKSSLLSALLGDMEMQSGFVNMLVYLIIFNIKSID